VMDAHHLLFRQHLRRRAWNERGEVVRDDKHPEKAPIQLTHAEYSVVLTVSSMALFGIAVITPSTPQVPSA
jgi:hypothetical protein